MYIIIFLVEHPSGIAYTVAHTAKKIVSSWKRYFKFICIQQMVMHLHSINTYGHAQTGFFLMLIC